MTAVEISKGGSPAAIPPPIAYEKSTPGCQGITATLVGPNFWRSCPVLLNNDAASSQSSIIIFFGEKSVSETSDFDVRVIVLRKVGREQAIGCL